MYDIDTQINKCSTIFRRHARAALTATRNAAASRRLGWADDAAVYMRVARREYYMADRARWESEATASVFALRAVSL